MPCFYKDAGQDEEADQGKDDVSMVIKITQMTIKMKMNQYKDDVHQDEDDDQLTTNTKMNSK